jgi:hypothetical protein
MGKRRILKIVIGFVVIALLAYAIIIFVMSWIAGHLGD